MAIESTIYGQKPQLWPICKAPDPPAWQRHVQGRATPQMGRKCGFWSVHADGAAHPFEDQVERQDRQGGERMSGGCEQRVEQDHPA